MSVITKLGAKECPGRSILLRYSLDETMHVLINLAERRGFVSRDCPYSGLGQSLISLGIRFDTDGRSTAVNTTAAEAQIVGTEPHYI